MSAVRPGKPKEAETPVKNLSIEIQEEIIWFHRDNRLNQWEIKQPPSITTRGKTFIEKFGQPEPIDIDEWNDLDHEYTKQLLKWNLDITNKNTMPIWITKATKLFDTKRPQTKQKAYLKLLARLASTSIASVPGLTSSGTTDQLLLSTISLVWIGTNTILGAIEPEIKPTCFDGQINPVTALGKEIFESPQYHKTQPFEKDKILIQGNQGAHDICQWAITAKLGTNDSTLTWETSLQYIWNTGIRSENQERLLTTSIRLTLTSPDLLPGWNGSSLYHNPITLLWSAANNLYGSIWRANHDSRVAEDNLGRAKMNEDENPTNPIQEHQEYEEATILIDTIREREKSDLPSNPSTPTRPIKSPNKADESPHKKAKIGRSMKPTTNQDYIEKKIHNPYNKSTNNKPTNNNFGKIASSKVSAGRKKKKPTTLKTYIRVQLPTQVENVQQWSQVTTETIELLHEVWKALCEVDSQNSTIEPWNEGPNSRTKPLRLESTMPTGKQKIDKKYVEQLKISWASSNTATELRFILGHKKPIQAYLTNKEVEKKLADFEAEVFVNRIQSEKRAIAGYLAGPIINDRTAEIISDLLKENITFKNNKISQIEIYEETITINHGNNKAKKVAKRSKAMHIMVRDEDKALARSCFATLFPSRPRGDYPLGIQYRFVPNTADTDFAISKTARKIAHRLMTKQASFLENCINREHRHFKDLFVIHDTMPNITLLKVLMALKSKRFPERQLFLCIEQEIEDGPVYFQYSAELVEEVDGIIPVIPLYLEGNFGASITKWMKPSSSIGTEGYEYDKTSNRVVPNGSNILSNLNEDWNQRINMYEYDDDSLSDDESDDGMGGFAIEFGNLDFDNNNRKSNLNDETRSLGTMNIQLPLDFVQDDDDDDSDQSLETKPYGLRQGEAQGPASYLMDPSMVTPTPAEWNTRVVHPPPIENTIREEDKQIFLRLLRHKDMMNLLQELPPLENTAPSKQDGGGDDT